MADNKNKHWSLNRDDKGILWLILDVQGLLRREIERGGSAATAAVARRAETTQANPPAANFADSP